MKKILSVFFNIDRTYLAGLNIEDTGVSIDYINSTIHRIDIDNINSEETKNGIAELNKIFYEMLFDPDEISITLQSESILVTQFPGKKDMPEDELNQLINFEIRQVFPQFDNSEFERFVIPLIPQNPDLQKMMAVIIPKEDFKVIEDIIQIINKPIYRVDITQLNSHTSFLFNYPEMNDKDILFVSVQGQFIDVSVLQNGQPIYYNLIALPNYNQAGEILENEYAKIVPQYLESIDACFYFGAGLDKDISMMLWETSSLLGIPESKRLNAFRMINTNLSKRENEYCARTLHIFPAPIGACLNPQHSIIKVV